MSKPKIEKQEDHESTSLSGFKLSAELRKKLEAQLEGQLAKARSSKSADETFALIKTIALPTTIPLEPRPEIQVLPGLSFHNQLCRFSSSQTRNWILEPARSDASFEYTAAVIRGDRLAEKRWAIAMYSRPLLALLQFKYLAAWDFVRGRNAIKAANQSGSSGDSDFPNN
jgi:hypothetical protein